MTARASVTPDQVRSDPLRFAEVCLPLNEKGRPWAWSPYQRRVLARAFRRDAAGRLLFRLVVLSEPKKSGKTFVAAVLLLWWGFTNARTEIIVAANDLEQSVSRVFKTAADLVKVNPALARHVTVRAQEFVFANGTVVTAIASEYRGAAGSRHSLAIFDEIWGYDSERAQRLYEELTPPPTEESAWVLVVTTAGFTGESVLLEAIYRRGLGGQRVDAELECYEAEGLFLFWSQTPRQPWQTPEYYAEQARSLRPTTFARLHRNEWVTAESRLITPELWDGCVDQELEPLKPTKDVPLFVGVDASVKSDTSAIVALYREHDHAGEWVTLARYGIWTPMPEMPIDLEQDLEASLRELAAQFRVQVIAMDPWQLMSTAQRLRRAGLNVQEYPQTVQTTQRMGAVLYESLKGIRVRLYPSAEMRQQALNVVGVEGLRGVRLAKEKASRKIDSTVALSLAMLAAMDSPVYAGPVCW